MHIIPTPTENLLSICASKQTELNKRPLSCHAANETVKTRPPTINLKRDNTDIFFIHVRASNKQLTFRSSQRAIPQAHAFAQFDTISAPGLVSLSPELFQNFKYTPLD